MKKILIFIFFLVLYSSNSKAETNYIDCNINGCNKKYPKTRSGKVLRGTMRKIADKEEYKMPATIDDPAILTEITDSLKTAGIL